MCTDSRDCGPGNITSEALCALVHNAIVRSLSHGEVPCHRPWTFPFVSQDPKSSHKMPMVTVRLPENMNPTILCTVECPMVRPQRLKAHLGLPTTSGLRPSSLEKHSCPCVGQWSSPTLTGQFHHDLRPLPCLPTVKNDCSARSRAITNASSSKPPPSFIPPVADASCRNPDHNKYCVFQYNSHPGNVIINSRHALSTNSLGDKPLALAASGTVNALCRNSKSE